MNRDSPKPTPESTATRVVQLSDRHWPVVFPYAGTDFFDDMGWGVSALDTGANLEWAAYGMRKLSQPDGRSILEIRFVDYGVIATPSNWTAMEIKGRLLPSMP